MVGRRLVLWGNVKVYFEKLVPKISMRLVTRSYIRFLIRICSY